MTPHNPVAVLPVMVCSTCGTKIMGCDQERVTEDGRVWCWSCRPLGVGQSA